MKKIYCILFLSVFFISCQSAKIVEYNPSLKTKKDEIKEDSSQNEDENISINLKDELISFYKDWKNVKYKYGGNSKKGIDCSAFTQRIYKKIFDINIPRTTKYQVKSGRAIKKSKLEMGDLVFFKTGKRDRHVGVYMGDGTFLHASIKGVKFTKLNKAYYKRKYWTSRRILE